MGSVVELLIILMLISAVVAMIMRRAALPYTVGLAITGLLLTAAPYFQGALALTLALSLPPELPHYDEIVYVTFAVVASSILAQGLTITPLLRQLGLIGDKPTPGHRLNG